MAIIHQPLLDLPLRKSSLCNCKFLCLILSLAAIVGSVTFLTTRKINAPLSTKVCDRALDPPSCFALVSELSPAGRLNGVNLLQEFLKKSASGIRDAVETTTDIIRRINDPKEQAAVADCLELMDLSLDRVLDSVTGSYSDVHSWLSSVLTNHVTCWDGLKNGSVRSAMEPLMKDLIARARVSLAMVVEISPEEDELLLRRVNGGFPWWVTRRDREILEDGPENIKANVVVAKDGSGNFKTVKEAAASAPEKSKNRYVIYVKKGTYKENVEIGKRKKNVMLVGDGMNSTIITGSLNVVDGSTTFHSATVAAVGDGFMAQDIWFQNTAGPEKHQAVALRVGADASVINRCRIDAHQDTLYAHSNRQFYRDSYITGTIDFIFGNAAVVFQNCKIVARKPGLGQSNMVTAQGRIDPNQNTGTSIQNCNVIPSPDLNPIKGTVKSYLGRPWKEYSRTVFMQSHIGDHIDPTGWAAWDGDWGLKTLYYGEYMNIGPGAGTAKRVKWPGYRVITDTAEARKFTVNEMIQGGAWLPSTGVSFTEGL